MHTVSGTVSARSTPSRCTTTTSSGGARTCSNAGCRTWWPNAATPSWAMPMPFRKRPAYRYAVKHSIYVHPDHLHSGLGRLLLPALIEACTAEGFRQMIAYVDADNLPSQNLHEAFGFRRVGLLEGVGYKFGRWTDSLLMQRVLGAGATHPPPPEP